MKTNHFSAVCWLSAASVAMLLLSCLPIKTQLVDAPCLVLERYLLCFA